MSLDARPGVRPDEPGDAAPEGGADLGPRELLAAAYRFAYHKKVGLALILALGLFTLLGTLFQQVPDGVRDDPQAWASWLRQVRPRYGGWTDVLAALGLFHVFGSWWFIATTGLLGVSILACTAHRTPRLWAAATRPHTHVREPFFDHAHLREQVQLDVTPSVALERLSDALRSRRFRVLPDAAAPGVGLYADRFRWAPFGTVVAHVAFVVLALGFLVTTLFGFRVPDLTVTVGERQPVAHGTDLVVEAVSFTDSYHPDGRPADYASDLVLHRQGVDVARHTVRVNDPLRFEGVTVYQSYFGTAADLTVVDATGATLHGGGVPLQWSTPDGEHTYGRVLLAGDLEVYVIAPASGTRSSDLRPGEVAVEVYRGGEDEPLTRGTLSQGVETTLEGLTYTFERERRYTGLLVTRDPGASWIWVGSALLVAGIVMSMLFRHRRVWARVTPVDGGGSLVRVACPDRADAIFEEQFRALVRSVKEDQRA